MSGTDLVSGSQMTLPLVSICIPTYNGQETLEQTLDSILAQHRDDLEVVICDDCSRDRTFEIALEYARRYPQVRAYLNETNLGMDGNFDVFCVGAVDKLWGLLAQHSDLDFVYFNYRIVNGDLSRDVGPPPLSIEGDAFFATPAEYFAALDHVPTFLAATVMRRAFWDAAPCERFFGTHYVQVGVWLYNFSGGKTAVVARPDYILCRSPEDSWKFQDGQMLFEIFSGSLEVYYLVYNSPQNTVPGELFERKMRDFLGALPNLVIFLAGKGFHLTPLLERRLQRLFGKNRVVYWLYVWPLTRLPNWCSALLRGLYRMPLTRQPLRILRRMAAVVGRATKI
jgi:glycosyltransferase involved in cell wall biosynthesis